MPATSSSSSPPWWLNTQGEEPNQLALARHAGTDVKMTSQVLGKLEAKALVRREADPADTRAKKLKVTKRGAALAEQAVTVVEAVDDRFFGAAGDRAAVLAMLRPLAGSD